MKPTQHLVILNRASLAAVDGWIHIVPKGELPNAEAGIVQVLDDTSMDSILANINKDKNRLGDNWPGIYAGREHFIYDANQDSEALAWFKEFEKRSNGIWAKDDGLTDIGAEAIKNRRYKFTSFTADPSDLKKVAGGNSKLPRYRVMAIETVGFTNQANGKELLTPITNRSQLDRPIKNTTMKKAPKNGKCPECGTKLAPNDDDDTMDCPGCDKTFAASSETDDATKTKNRKHMKKIANELGLADEASEDSIFTAVTKLKNRVTELEPLGAKNTELKNRIAEFDGEQVDGLLVEHGIKDEKVINRLKPVLTPLKNREERLAWLADAGYKAGNTERTETRILNRGNGTGTMKEVAAATDDRAVAKKIKNRANELKGQSKRSFDDCWKQAKEEITALK